MSDRGQGTGTTSVDVAVVGGGPAGLSAALQLARSRRSVIVVDAGKPRNAPASAVHGLLSRDGTPPGELLRIGREEVERYGGRMSSGTVDTARRDGDRLIVAVQDGPAISARRLLVTTGLTDVLPPVAGLREGWGTDVVHCPYCHGWEVRDRAVGVLATGPASPHLALLFRQLSDDVLYFADGRSTDGDDLRRLRGLGIPVVEGRVRALERTAGRLTGVRIDGGEILPREVLAVTGRMVARAGFLADLGLRAVEHPSGMGEHLVAGPTGRTAVPGVWAAGNVCDLTAQVSVASAAGAVAAMDLNADLALEDADRAASSPPATPAPDAASA